MDSKRVYRILSLLFLVLTVLFFLLYAREKNFKDRLSEDFVSEAINNIRSDGIEISESVIHTSVTDVNIYNFDIPVIEEHNNKLSKAVSEAVFGQDVSTSRFETPDGISVSIYDKESKSELGRIVFNNCDLSFSLLKNGINISGIESPVMNGRTDLIDESEKDLVSLVCKKLTNSSKMNYRISGCSGDSDFFVVTAVQTVGGYDVSDAFVNFSFDGNELVSVSGKWIVEEPKAKYNNTLTDGVNVLYTLDFEQIKSIEYQRIVYVIKNADSDRYYLIPMWEISYMDKSGQKKIDLVDAI